MAFDDQFRLSAHAVFTDKDGKILQLKATYGEKDWGLPGGSLEPGETIHEALIRECREELGVEIDVLYMSGMYFHKKYNSHACVFKCEMQKNSEIKLSSEHSEFRYFTLDEMTPVQRHRVMDCLQFDGKIKSAKF
jgi:8-oxo-dGTP pyrophosphatase MutT (NUDIX family)